MSQALSKHRSTWTTTLSLAALLEEAWLCVFPACLDPLAVRCERHMGGNRSRLASTYPHTPGPERDRPPIPETYTNFSRGSSNC